MKKTTSNFLLGFLAGAAAGALAGLLFAPEKGSQTRQNLRKKIMDLADQYGLNLGDLLKEIGMDEEAEPDSESKAEPTVKARKPRAKKEVAKPKKPAAKRKYTRKAKEA